MKFIERGVPAVLVVTDAFEVVAQLQVEALGLSEVPKIVLPHPIGGLAEPLVRERAQRVLDALLRMIGDDDRA